MPFWSEIKPEIIVKSLKQLKNTEIYHYCPELKKWKKPQGKKELTLIYVSGALRTFMANLQEITPEKNFVHRKYSGIIVEIEIAIVSQR